MATNLLLYVDDMLIASKSNSKIQSLKKKLNNTFEMKDLGDAKRILGMDILRNRKAGKLFLSQQNYIEKVLKRFKMHESKSVITPFGQQFKLSKNQAPRTDSEKTEMNSVPYASGVGSLMYAMVRSRPDLARSMSSRPDVAHSMSMVSRYMADLGRMHWEALKWIMRYMRGTANLELMFERTTQVRDPLQGYVDSDYAANLDSRKSLTGYVFTLYGTTISWRSMLLSVVALSTTEAEYIAMTEAVKEAMWLKGILKDFGVLQKAVVVHCDNQSTIHVVKHQVFNERSKHIIVKLHFVRDIIDKGAVIVQKIHTDDNAADMLTKALPSSKFKLCSELVKVDSWDVH